MTDLDALPLGSSEHVPSWDSWLETAVLCTLALAAAALMAGSHPSALRSALPWLALAPLLAGLRYGASQGVTCGAVQAGALLAAAQWSVAPVEVPVAEVALGWLVAGLLPGQFRDTWARRIEKSESDAVELRNKLDGLVRDSHAIKISHDRLQRGSGRNPSTQRDEGGALEVGSLKAMGGRVLALFQNCASVRAATLHLVDRRGEVGPAVATLGSSGSEKLAATDPLVRESVRLGEVMSARGVPAGRGTVAAVPLVDPEGTVRAVVVIRDMPFLALRTETLTLLGLLGARITALAPAPKLVA